MDLEENIRIAAEVYILRECEGVVPTSFDEVKDIYIAGAKSQAAKDYWYNEFKRQKIQSDSGQDQSLRNQPMKPHEGFNGKSEHQMIYYGTSGNGPTDEENELWQKQVVEPTYQYEKFVEYRAEHPEEEISYKEWADKFIYGDGILEQIKNIPSYKMSDLPCDLSYLMDGTYEKYERYLIDNPDRPISFDNWKYMVEHYEKPELLSKQDIDDVVSKRIGIIGHVNHGKPMIIVLNDSWDTARQALNKIESIVPIADIIPEPIISKEELSKQEFLLMHDKAMERSITEETYKESRAWDIKKEKKVSHKRTNKRR